MEWVAREDVERRQVELIVEYLRRELSMAEFAAFKLRLDTRQELHHVDVHAAASLVRPNPGWKGKPDAPAEPSARSRAVLEAAVRRSVDLRIGRSA